MGNVNIFESMRKVTSRIEPFHTQFLADMLAESLERDRTLFDEFWALTAPQGWEVPKHAQAKAEVDLGKVDDAHVGRIDLCIFASAPSRVLGVEIKTTDSSVTERQLYRYHSGLVACYADHEVAVAYLTPFNKVRAGELAAQLRTVEEYSNFAKKFPESRHVSWLDVSEIASDYDHELWRQHRAFVRTEISSYDNLRDRSQRDRSFNEFFGDIAADRFWADMKALGFEPSPGEGARVDLSKVRDIPAFVEAFKTLISQGDGIPRENRQREKADKFSNREYFSTSEFNDIHQELLGLSRQFEYVWVEGKKDYGIRVAHSAHPSTGVSIARSLDRGHLLVGQPR